MPSRFQATSPDTTLSYLDRIGSPDKDVQDIGDDVAAVADAAPVQVSTALQEPVFLDKPAKGKNPDLEKVSTSDAGQRMVALTQKTLGDFRSPEGEVIVTTDSLKAAESPPLPTPQFTPHAFPLLRKEPVAFQSPYRIEIDPNSNRAIIYDSAGSIVKEFSIGTGDITGTRYDRKYFTPTGSFEVTSEVPFRKHEGSYGPWWMGINAPRSPRGGGFGLHGQYEATSVDPEGGFINKGYVSHGCVRFKTDDMNTVSKYLDIGSKVDILEYIPVHDYTRGSELTAAQ